MNQELTEIAQEPQQNDRRGESDGDPAPTAAPGQASFPGDSPDATFAAGTIGTPTITAGEPPATAQLGSAAAAHLPSHRPISPAKRVLLLLISATGLAWIGSIAVHALLVCAGIYLFARYLVPPKMEVALGDGSAERTGLLYHEPAAGGSGLLDAPRIDVPPQLSPPAPSLTPSTDKPQAAYAGGAELRMPDLVWGEGINIGSGSKLDLSKGPAGHQASRQAGQSTSSSPPAPASHGRGNGSGGSVGDGAAKVHGGQAGVPAGTPNPTLPAPVYPEESRVRGEEGVVKLLLVVRDDGTVGTVDVVSEPPYPRLTRSAIDAAHQAHFDRAYAGLSMLVPYNFTLH